VTLALYFAPGSSSMAVHIALREIGAPFEARPLSMKGKEQRSTDYLAINPEGNVPTLVIDGRPLTEVSAILFFLARRFPEARLLPDDVEGQARAISWMSFLAATVHPARRQGLDHAREVYALADRRLGAGTWALGAAYSVADIHLFRLYWRFAASLNPPAEAFPALAAHHDRMLQRPAVRQTIEVESAIGYELPA
jgi:glutathione S-transferase